MSKRGAAFRTVSGAPRIPRNAFDLSSERKFTCDLFQLTPVMVEDCLPGDNWRINAEAIIRMNPMAVPIMHEINMSVHYFFCSYRMLTDKWRKEDPAVRTFDYEEYYTGGEDGMYKQLPPTLDVNYALANDPNSLYNYLYSHKLDNQQSTFKVSIWPLIAYNIIYNEYYRDQTLIPKVSLTSKDWQYRAWEKDYFTSALPWTQRGTAPALPVAITDAHIDFGFPTDDRINTPNQLNTVILPAQIGIPPEPGIAAYSSGSQAYGVSQAFKNALNKNTVEIQNDQISTFDINTLRLTVQTQKWLERNARAGARFPEHIEAHHGVKLPDSRVQRPEYLGGMRSPIIVSEVLQTSQTTNTHSLGEMGGHGIMADRAHCASYFVREPGVIIGIMSILPVPSYMSQGIDRQWTKQSRYDEYMSEFIHLGEQAIKMSEIYAQEPIPDMSNEEIFGYQGRFNEYRYRRNTVHGLMLSDLTMWHMSRKFATKPLLNKDFVQANEQERRAMKRALAANTEPMFLVNFANVCPHVVRPLPWLPDPGNLDHY